MANIKKVALLVLDKDRSKILVCRPKYNFHSGRKQYIMPGGDKMDGETDDVCLARQIAEELASRPTALSYVGTYIDVDASDPTKEIEMALYSGELTDEPEPSHEIEGVAWIGADHAASEEISPIIKNKIIPDLVRRKILHGPEDDI